jgi:hypothetical protein
VIVVPTVLLARRSGSQVQCAANLHGIGQAVQLYSSELRSSGPAGLALEWSRVLVTPRLALLCPTADLEIERLSYAWNADVDDSLLRRPKQAMLPTSEIVLIGENAPGWNNSIVGPDQITLPIHGRSLLVGFDRHGAWRSNSLWADLHVDAERPRWIKRTLKPWWPFASDPLTIYQIDPAGPL